MVPDSGLYAALIVVPAAPLLYFTLIPAFSGGGAAVASSITCLAATMVSLLYFRHVTGVLLGGTLVPGRSGLGGAATAKRSNPATLRLRGDAG